MPSAFGLDFGTTNSAAAIAVQGLIRLSRVLSRRGEDGARYEQAGLQVLDTLLEFYGEFDSCSLLFPAIGLRCLELATG